MVELFYGRFLAVGVLEGVHQNLLGLLWSCLFCHRGLMQFQDFSYFCRTRCGEHTYIHLSVTNGSSWGWGEMQWAAGIHRDCFHNFQELSVCSQCSRSWGEMLGENAWRKSSGHCYHLLQKARCCVSLSCSLMLPLIHLMQVKTSVIAFPSAQFLIWKTHPFKSTVCWKTSQWKPAQGQCWREH